MTVLLKKFAQWFLLSFVCLVGIAVAYVVLRRGVVDDLLPLLVDAAYPAFLCGITASFYNWTRAPHAR